MKCKGKDGKVEKMRPNNVVRIESGGGLLSSFVVVGVGVCGMEIPTSLISSLVCIFFVAIISTRLLLKSFKWLYITNIS